MPLPIMLLLLLASPQQVAAAAVPTGGPASVAADAAYRLGVNDELQISVFGTHPIDVKTRVKEDGSVTVPMLGDVPASGQTTREFAETIAKRLRSGKLYTNPVVNVEVVNFVSNAVTVFGSLQSPGIYPLDRPLTLAMALARAGGTRSDAADYVILKRAGRPDQRVRTDDPEGLGLAQPLVAGDTLFVPPAPMIFVYGQVNKPGRIPLRSDMTVMQALAEAGGPTLAGSRRRVTLTRGSVSQKRVPLDAKVQPGDVFYVNEKLF
ncbi:MULTISPECIES: SLBB domain-containing protein [unclassified Sphingomonas]|uniref:SLBB domain-containing protein n=1 Tax=unclassified Sphingomonas TaxID=196159 RepID=UPI001D11A8ED|nr:MULTISPECIES: SLBB domain-containing protein [unclassified Sphingomonas]MCC2979780.1 SLBB domain-containing protein [Sphingomonas sp. IC4-52]MCD2314541.1 SLBB domain-containing protein [Sphingomonas sp. IC-11]